LVVVLATWSRLLACDTVARLFGVSWSTVVAAVNLAVERGLAERDLSGAVLLGIDELSRRKGHIYHTNVYDLSTKRLLWSAEGRGKETISAFFDWFGPERSANIQGICCDMWANYIEVCRERAPHAVLVFDKFHIVSHLLNAVNEVRKMEAKLLRDSNPDLLKGTRYIFLKNPWNLTETQKQRLAELECWNLRTLRAYLLKELFAHLWEYTSKTWATRYLQRWFWWATHSRSSPCGISPGCSGVIRTGSSPTSTTALTTALSKP
jgi:transposase